MSRGVVGASMGVTYSRARLLRMNAAKKRQEQYWARKCGPVRSMSAENLSPEERAKYGL